MSGETSRDVMLDGLPVPRRSRWLHVVGLVIGLVMLVAALIAVWSQRDTMGAALTALRSPSWLHVGLLLLGVATNVVLSGTMFSLLMSRYGTVGRMEMQALIAATALLNYLPLRPGLLGRLAYHKKVNGIALADSGRTVLQAMAVSMIVVLYLAIILGVSAELGVSLWFGVLAPLPLLAVGGAWPGARIWLWATLMRYVEVLAWALHYTAAFRLLDAPIGPEAALAMAGVSVIATMVPLVSNGLGLREWAIGLAAPLLTDQTLELGITAELVNRAAELLVVTGLGLSGIAYLVRRRR